MHKRNVFESSEGFLIVFNGDFWTDGRITFGNGSLPMLSLAGGVYLRAREVNYFELSESQQEKCDLVVDMHNPEIRVFVTTQGIMTVYNGLYWTDGEVFYGTDPEGPFMPYSTNHIKGSFIELLDLTPHQISRYFFIKRVTDFGGGEVITEPNTETVHINVQKELNCG